MKKSRIAIGLLIIAAAFAIFAVVPSTFAFNQLLSSQVMPNQSLTKLAESQTRALVVDVFKQLYWILLLCVAVISAAFLILEETITSWYKGSYLRFFLQLALYAICFAAFFYILILPLPIQIKLMTGVNLNAAKFAYIKLLDWSANGKNLMLICTAAGFLLMSFAGLYLASPSNRDGMPGITLWMKRKVI